MTPVNADDLPWTTPETENAKWRRKQLGEAADGDALGCSLYELPPGERSWPYHYHTANEEALYVLAGEGTLRLDGEAHPLRPGEFAAFPADQSGAHRVVNDGDATLRYLVVSTMREPDVTVYPDSGKFGVYAGSPPGGRESRSLEGYYRIDEDVEYWEGETEE
ncbi:cupin [Halobacteriales archaeon SW_8_68_21]|nr:MAG: cupin [Halobacteriales archaeon SW_8_68_21]